MNFVTASLQELARASRLFIAAVEPGGDGSVRAVNARAHAFVKIAPGDVAEGMKASPWQSGASYVRAAPGVDSSLSVVINSTRQVFACLLSADGASTDEPVSLSAGEYAGADGYVWRYLFTVGIAAQNKFDWAGGVAVQTCAPHYQSGFTTAGLPVAAMTAPVVRSEPTGFHPYVVTTPSGVVRAVLLPAGELAEFMELYAVVEEAGATGSGATATPSVSSGQIDAVAPTTLGSGYTGAVATTFGDGVGAVVTPVIVDGAVMSYVVTNPGSGYTWAKIVVSAGAVSGAAALLPSSGDDDYSRDVALIGKTTSIIDPVGATSLDTYLCVAAQPVVAGIVKGAAGNAGTPSTVVFTPIIRLSSDGQFDLTENMQLNTRVQIG